CAAALGARALEEPATTPRPPAGPRVPRTRPDPAAHEIIVSLDEEGVDESVEIVASPQAWLPARTALLSHRHPRAVVRGQHDIGGRVGTVHGGVDDEAHL